MTFTPRLSLPVFMAVVVLAAAPFPAMAADEVPAAEAPAASDTPAQENTAKAAGDAAVKKDETPKEPAPEEKATPQDESAPVAKEQAEKPKPAKAKKPAKDGVVSGKKDGGNPVQEWIAAENKLIDTLSANDQRSFFVMRNKHGVIRSVHVVRRDVASAVKACGKANPDIKAAMDERFKQWENAVMPVLELADKYLKEEIETQKIVFPSDFKHVLKLNDKAFKYGEDQIEKTPVTDKEACAGLLKSMDRTENKMVELLQDMLLPESVIRERAARAEEAEEARKAKKASE